MRQIERSLLHQTDQMLVDRLRIRDDRIAIDSQKHIDDGERHPLVTIDERVVLNETFQQRGRLMNERVVVPGLRSIQRGLERARISHARRAAIPLDQLLMEEERISSSEVLRHLANDRYNSSRSFKLS